MRVTRENLSVCKAFVDFWDHKLERPLRPITSSIGSPVYAVSKHLVSILAPLRKNSYTVKNSAEFVHGLKQYSIADDEIMVSFDVKSLFTSIPVDLALTITKERLQQDQNLAECTNMIVCYQHDEASGFCAN